MIIPGSSNALLLGGDDQYQIARSLRFNSPDSAYLNRTPASAGNRKTWTWSGWVKLSNLSINRCLMEAGVSGLDTYTLLYIGDDNKLRFTQDEGSGGTAIIASTALYRDLSAWYHIVYAIDSTQATAANRIKIYVNGEQITSFSNSTYFSQNKDTYINSTFQHRIGNRVRSSGQEFSGYLTEINFVDGQALTPSSFGETDAATGVWKPKKYTGTYGTNGFYLNFSDNSGTTSTTLGKDSSGNSNNWTPNNFSVTAGTGNDSLVDTPTQYGTDTGAGGEVRGNYATLNPLSTTAGTYTQGNLRYVGPNTGTWYRTNSTLSVSTGKWYWEVTLGNAPYSPRANNTSYNAFGFGVATAFNNTDTAGTQTTAVILADNGYFKNFSGSWTDGGTTFSSGDTLSVAVDLDANTFTFYRNNTQITTGTIGGTAGRELTPVIVSYSGAYGVLDVNFGQRPFSYTAPSGYKALCTTNLSAGTITTSGSFTGNATSDGPFVYLNGVPTAMTINGNSVTFGTHADKLSNGFKVRSSSSSYNASGSNTYSITTTGDKFKNALAQANP